MQPRRQRKGSRWREIYPPAGIVGGNVVVAISHYLDLVHSGRIDLSGMLTDTFRLEEWRNALTLTTAERPEPNIKKMLEPCASSWSR